MRSLSRLRPILAALVLAPAVAAAQAKPRPAAPKPAAPKTATPKPATAPVPTPPPPKVPLGGIAGALVDSIHGGPLVGATVLVEAANRATVSDDDGRFVLDSLPPGGHVVRVTHPLLDSLFLSLVTPPLRVAADSVVDVTMTTPSMTALFGPECPPAASRLGPATFGGRVLDADSRTPAAGVRVLLVWMQLAVGTDIGVRRTPRVRQATTDARGYYRICGAPGDPQDATVQAERGRVRTAEVPVTIGETGVGLRSLLIGAPGDTAGVGQATASGRVVDTVGVPVERAQVSVEGAAPVGVTNARGEFTLEGLPSGTHALVVRRIGFAPSRTIVDLSALAPVQVAVQLERATPRLAPVVVTAQAEALSRVGFEDRQRRGMGKFVGPEDIQRMQPLRVTSVLQTIPGLRVVPTGNGGFTVQSSRGVGGSCVTYWVDGARFQEMTPGELDMTFSGSSMAAVEVYQPTDVPAQFSTGGMSSCTAVVIWTQASVQSTGRSRR